MSSAHQILGLPANASDEDIRKAYRRLAMQHHPDKNGGTEESKQRFVEIKRAFDELTRNSNDEAGSRDGKKHDNHNAPSTRGRYTSPSPHNRRGPSPPFPQRRRSEGEPRYEERRPRDASPPRNESPQANRGGDRRPYRPAPPPKDREDLLRDRRDSCREPQRRSYSRPRSPPIGLGPFYATRSPGCQPSSPRGSDERRPSTLHRSSTVPNFPTSPSTQPRYQDPRYAPSPHVRASAYPHPVTLPSFEQLHTRLRNARFFALRIGNYTSKLEQWVKGPSRDGERAVSIMRTRTVSLPDGLNLHQDRVFELHETDGWRDSPRAVLALHEIACVEHDILDDACRILGTLVNRFVGPESETGIDWSEPRQHRIFFAQLNSTEELLHKLPYYPRTVPSEETPTVSGTPRYQEIAMHRYRVVSPQRYREVSPQRYESAAPRRSNTQPPLQRSNTQPSPQVHREIPQSRPRQSSPSTTRQSSPSTTRQPPPSREPTWERVTTRRIRRTTYKVIPKSTSGRK